VVAIEQHKSAGVAFLLNFLFGPLGMFYSTVGGAVLMLVLCTAGSFVVGIATLGLGLAIWLPACWFVSIIWACVTASGVASTSVVSQHTQWEQPKDRSCSTYSRMEQHFAAPVQALRRQSAPAVGVRDPGDLRIASTV